MTAAVDWVDYNGRRFADADALEWGDTGQALSWSELEERVAATAGVLRAQFSVSAGDRVCVLATNDVWCFILQFATMRLGAILVPLNWRLSPAELQTLAADCRPSLVVHDREWAQRARALAADVGAATVGWGSSDDPDNPDHPDHLDARLRSAVPVRDEGRRQLSDPTHILYTSGTTGIPKGSLVTAETLAWQALNIAEPDQITGPGDRLLCPLPLFHAGGLNTLANPILMAGGCVSVLARFEPGQCVELLDDPARAFTHFGSVPTMYQLMTEVPAFASARFESAKHLQVAGGVATQWLLDAWAAKGVQLQTHYGGTEMGPTITAMPKAWAASKAGSCGFPVRHTRVRLVSREGHDVGDDEIGEIWISGPSVTPGYFNNPEATAASFSGEWFRTGDAGRRDKDGFFYLVDRYKDMYKSGGENVFPAEVERVLMEHPDIAEAVVIGVPDARWGETGVALIVTRNATVLTRDDVYRYCDGQLARFKIPSAVVSVEALPRNATGKVNKAEIKARYLADRVTPA